jgi:hypothetical protein
MKSKILTGALLWLAIISGLHVTLNVGWGELAHNIRVMLGQARRTLYVGFLPVT